MQALIQAEGSIDKINDENRKFAEFRWKNLPTDKLWSTFLNHYRFVVGGNPHVALESYRIPFLQASSLRINEALLMAATSGFVPFTDSKVHDRMMNLKVTRSLTALADDASLRERLEIAVPAALPYQHLTLSVLDRLIPDEELAKRSITELVQYRRANQHLLDRMRLSLVEWSLAIRLLTTVTEFIVRPHRHVPA